MKIILKVGGEMELLAESNSDAIKLGKISERIGHGATVESGKDRVALHCSVEEFFNKAFK